MDTSSTSRPEVFGIVPSALIGISFFLFALLVFDLLRAVWPRFVYHRQYSSPLEETRNHNGNPLFFFEQPSKWPLSWLPLCISYTEEQLINTHGYDVALYLRFLCTQTKLFAVLSVFTAAVLYPTYTTAENRFLEPGSPGRPNNIELVSLANVPDNSPRLWVTLVCDIFVVAIICLFLYIDISKYNEYRCAYRAERNNPSNYTIIVQNIPSRCRTTAYLRSVFERLLPGQVHEVYLVPDASYLVTLRKRLHHAISQRRHLILSHRKSCRRRRRQEQIPNNSNNNNNDKNNPDGKLQHSISECESRIERITMDWHSARDKIDDKMYTSHVAFVVFRTMKAASIAATAPIWTGGNGFNIARAPEPKAVNWNWLAAANYTKRIRKYITFIVVVSMTIIWVVPATFIQTLRNVVTLISNEFPSSGITNFFENNPLLASIIEGILPPLLLYIALLIVPHVMRALVSCERPNGKAVMESKIRNFVLLFYLMSNFLYAVTLGSAVDVWTEILQDPSKIGPLLSVKVPAQSTFLMKYVLVNSFFGSVMGMLNPGRLLVYPILKWRARTKREHENADGIFTHYPYAKMYAVTSMIASICFVYSTIAPVICAVALLYFATMYICTKNFMLYTHRGRYESGGYLFRDAWTGVHVGLYIHQLSMIGIFSLKKAVTQAVLEAISLVGTIWFTWYCKQKFFKGGKHGDVMDVMSGMGDEAVVTRRIADLYTHPALRELELESDSDTDSEPESVVMIDAERGGVNGGSGSGRSSWRNSLRSSRRSSRRKSGKAFGGDRDSGMFVVGEGVLMDEVEVKKGMFGAKRCSVDESSESESEKEEEEEEEGVFECVVATENVSHMTLHMERESQMDVQMDWR